MSQITEPADCYPHDPLDLPAFVRRKALPDESGVNICTFCREDLSVLQVTEGTLSAELDGSAAVLQEGDIILINTHRSSVLKGAPSARFTQVFINPSVFRNNLTMPNYIIELISPSAPSSLTLPRGTQEAERTAGLITSISESGDQNLMIQRLRMMGYVNLIMAEFLTVLCRNPENLPDRRIPESGNLDRMLTYIHLHYQSRIQLSDIADAGNVSRSRCSPLFRKYLHVTPIEYVNDYRLEISRGYLLNRDLSIATVANACGFSGQSYYSKLFMRKYGCTPTAYRAQNA